jgi:hypothetical protein
MIRRRELSEDQALSAIENGEFPQEVTAAARCVVVVMSQDWCPQWTAMDAYLSALEKGGNGGEQIEVFGLLYNKVSYFGDFRRFKEKTWGNYQVPYVRYYKNGQLVDQSNFVPRAEFLRRCGLES